MSRATDLCELYQNAVKMLIQNPQEWIGLLASAAKFYKLSFDKNVLVYMQRPEAGLIATMRDWNIRTGRYVNKHSKAIAVLDMSESKINVLFRFCRYAWRLGEPSEDDGTDLESRKSV